MSTLTCLAVVLKTLSIHHGKQSHPCKTCGRQFVEAPQQQRLDSSTKHLIDQLLSRSVKIC